MRKLFFFLLASFLCIQCKNECIDENIKLGNVSFDSNTIDYIDLYEDQESISFISYNGQVKTLKIEKLESTNPFLCVKVTCRPSYELEGANGCEYYDSEDRHYTLTDGDLVLSVQAGMELLIPETESYYEYVNVGITNQDTSHFAGVITAANSVNHLEIQNSILSNYFEYAVISELSEYERVLEYENDEAFIVYKKGKGIVNYEIDGVRWTLVE